ncbi:MAG: MgtC/SapB family protein [Leptonema sp. (in: Bacteria)]|nr:MgtC/SapB family protein [Leptonema sp. (in: bacteria)]
MLSHSEILLRLLLAAVFGALIGLERERKHWVAGIRTHMMVSVGSCLIMMVSAFGFFDVLGNNNVTLDPSRVAAQVVSGIGFIGAGTILFLKQGVIRGLTTASGVWTVAGIGLATGGGMFFAASVTTVIALIILWGLQPLSRYYLNQKSKDVIITLLTKGSKSYTTILNNIIESTSLKMQSFTIEKSKENLIIRFKLSEIDTKNLNQVIQTLEEDKNVKEIKIRD